MPTLLEKKTDTTRGHRWEARRITRNVGGSERGIRLGIGVASAIGAAFVAPILAKTLLGVVGFAGLLTGVAGYCPANRLRGRDSYHR